VHYRRALNALSLAGALAALDEAHAATPQEKALAESLYKEGKAMLATDLAGGCARLEESQRLDPQGGTALNLADCQEKLGRLATAFGTYQIAEELARQRNNAARVALIKKKLAALEPRLPKLTLSPNAPLPEGAVITLDGIALSPIAMSTELAVDPGEHVAIVTAPDFEERRATITLEESERKTLSLEPLSRKPPPRPPPPPPPPPVEWTLPTIALAGGLTVVASVAGIITGVRALSLGETVQAECPDRACSPAGLTALEDGRTFATASNVTFAIAGALAATTVVVSVVHLVSDDAATSAPAVGAWVDGDGAAVAAFFRF
jgi:hypothetical protein